jgi:ABC-type glycerol-3-phosphate transport system substrate-binding protein
MRRFLGSLALLSLLTAGLAACGNDTNDSATDPDTTSTSNPEPPAHSSTVAILSMTAAGGKVSMTPVPLPDEKAVRSFSAQFTQPALGRKIAATVADTDVPEGQALAAAVVAVSCDVPPSVTITETDDGVVVTADEVPSPLPECFASVTSVAVILVDAYLL